MKKTLLHISAVFAVLLLWISVFAADATAASGHICNAGFQPVIDITGYQVSVEGCLGCHESFVSKGAPYVKMNFSGGTVFDVDDYTLDCEIYGNCVNLLKGTDSEIIFLYSGRNFTYYPLTDKKPTETGDYTVFISTKKTYNYYLETGLKFYSEKTSYENYYYMTQAISYGTDFTLAHMHVLDYSVNGKNLCVKCSCGDKASAAVEIESGAIIGHAEESDFPLSEDDWNKITDEALVRLYEGTEGTEYALSSEIPSKAGSYTVSLVPASVWENNPKEIDSCRTEPVLFKISDSYHKWEYASEGFSIVGSCIYCDAEASVTLDNSAVYENARQLETDGSAEDLYYEDDWRSYPNISAFTVLYDGKEIVINSDNAETTALYSSTKAPSGSGNYTAYLAILSDPSDVSAAGIIAKSEGMPFYVAGCSFKRCTVKEYGENEIALFDKPEYSDGYYRVGTRSELLWCVYNITADMKIILTNDIVVNPITVSDNGNISAGALVIYEWPGIGSYNSPFSGTIDGNGHTIYGIYMPHGGQLFGINTQSLNDGCTGFICWGKDATVNDLTIESSYFKGRDAAGAFFGKLEVSGNACLSGCYSLYNLVSSDNIAGGIVGLITGSNTVSGSSDLYIDSCVNDSWVNGTVAGGIAGKTSGNESELIGNGAFRCCRNYGKITGKDFAAGIIGSITVWHHIGFKFIDCLNTGTIKASSYESGIIGELNTNGNGGALAAGCVQVLCNVNIGGLSSGCKNISDIIAKTGNNDYCQIGLLTLFRNIYSKSKSAYPAALADAPEADKLSAKQIENGNVCRLIGHTESTRYSDVIVAGCETEGSKKLCCSTCGTVLRTVTTPPRGHSYDAKGNCIYCQTVKSNTASVFSTGTWLAVAVVALVLCGAAALVIIRKKRS